MAGLYDQDNRKKFMWVLSEQIDIFNKDEDVDLISVALSLKKDSYIQKNIIPKNETSKGHIVP